MPAAMKWLLIVQIFYSSILSAQNDEDLYPINKYRYQEVGLEMVSIILPRKSGCQSACKLENEKLLNFLQKTHFIGYNMLLSVRPYSNQFEKFWIDQCLRVRQFCAALSDVWLTYGSHMLRDTTQGPTDHLRDAESFPSWNDRGSKCFWEPVKQPSISRSQTCRLGETFAKLCLCRLILVIFHVRRVAPEWRASTANAASRREEAMAMTRAAATGANLLTEPWDAPLDSGQYCQPLSICERLSKKILRYGDSSVHNWVCNAGFVVDYPKLKVGKTAADDQSKCGCTLSPDSRYAEMKHELCVTADHIRHAMQRAGLTPLQITSMTMVNVQTLSSSRTFMEYLIDDLQKLQGVQDEVAALKRQMAHLDNLIEWLRVSPEDGFRASSSTSATDSPGHVHWRFSLHEEVAAASLPNLEQGASAILSAPLNIQNLFAAPADDGRTTYRSTRFSAFETVNPDLASKADLELRLGSYGYEPDLSMNIPYINAAADGTLMQAVRTSSDKPAQFRAPVNWPWVEQSHLKRKANTLDIGSAIDETRPLSLELGLSSTRVPPSDQTPTVVDDSEVFFAAHNAIDDSIGALEQLEQSPLQSSSSRATAGWRDKGKAKLPFQFL